MSEFIGYVIATIVCLLIVVLLNSFVNKIKTDKCEKAGGTIVLNTSNADITSCIIPPKSK